MNRARWIGAISKILPVSGLLSFFSLGGIFLACHDIWHDFASPEVWARAGKALPDWYSPVNRCPLEWGVLQVSFLLIILFHILLMIRWALRQEP